MKREMKKQEKLSYSVNLIFSSLILELFNLSVVLISSFLFILEQPFLLSSIYKKGEHVFSSLNLPQPSTRLISSSIFS